MIPRSSFPLAFLLTATVSFAQAAPSRKPNIVFILADDLGYGDVRCLNPEGKIPTPHMDRLAAGGMAFTDAHSSSSVCTPTRYGVLTGRYNWRSRLKSGVLGGASPTLIETGRLTVPEFLKQHGYKTACIGKWHLGLDWERKPNAPAFENKIEKAEDTWKIDFSKPFQNGPVAVGFQHFFGIAASLDMAPYAYLENDHVIAQPTVDKSFPMIAGKEKPSRKGPAAADFEAEQVLPTITAKVEEYIQQAAKDSQEGKPFFLYMPLNAPHTPILPSKEWLGKSGISPYADFVMQTDATIGRVLDALKQAKIDSNTLLIVTSDNGFAPYAGYPELQAKGHNPSANLRGTKADIFDGGHRVPFLVQWPGHVKPGSQTNQLTCLNDLFATCADVLGEKLPQTPPKTASVCFQCWKAAPNIPSAKRSSIIPSTVPSRSGRPSGNSNSVPGLRWLERPQTAFFRSQRSSRRCSSTTSRPTSARQTNLQDKHPEIVSRLTSLLEKYVTDGRSTRALLNKTPVS